MKKLRVGIIFGGKSAEHEVSIHSAKNIYKAIDKKKFEPILIGINKDGTWNTGERALKLLNKDYAPLKKFENTKALTIQKSDLSIPSPSMLSSIDVVFPVLHGPYGEDGSIQGIFKILDKPIVGSHVLGSAICMDKDIMKRLLIQANLPVVKFRTIKNNQIERFNYLTLSKEFGKVFFVKPANLGSSIGVSKVRNAVEFNNSVKLAFEFDTKIIIEKAVDAREIECSVLGNDNPEASIPGEIVVKDDFYSYSAKYLDENGAVAIIPADLTKKQKNLIMDLSIKSFIVLECSGMARVDFFLDRKTNKIYINELNTIPGFTDISMYPKMWEASGVSQKKLLDKLICLAVDEYKTRRSLRSSI